MIRLGVNAMGRLALALALATTAPAPVSAQVSSVSVTGTNVSCNGGSNGTASAVATGGTAPYSYLWSNGRTSQTITGLTVGPYSVTVRDSAAPQVTTSGSITIYQPTALTAQTSTTNTAFGASTGTASVSPSGGVSGGGGAGGYTYRWNTGATTATIQSLAAGDYTVMVTDANGCSTSRTATVASDPAPPALGTDNPPSGVAGNAYSHAFTATGGVTPYSYAIVSGALPAGLTLAVNGVLSGTPTTLGSFTFTVRVRDSRSPTPAEAARSYTLSIARGTVVVEPTTLPAAPLGEPYSQTFSPRGGVAPYTYSVIGTFPPGLALNGAVLSGTPTAAGSFSFTLTATDGSTGPGGPSTGSASYTVAVFAPVITISPRSVPPAPAGEAYSQQLTGGGGATPYTFAVVGGALPAGVTLASDGRLSGLPTTPGTFDFQIRATDARGNRSDPVAYTLVVQQPTQPPTPPVAAVPTLSEWALMLFGLMLAALAAFAARRRRPA